ncbi:GlcG/HbpS family heme-binding protein [Halopseudomonas pelagia]|uniref:GlcG/HbpS family heme-binding protein n=1 Tax=Halopseudomonas pelagia TaxID=553151 RepID=UPI0003A31576|nr:heme-binding protein [Halopseudomonas pelagia]|tara:strand:- start:2696 stop:3097 length:402 start_codon:yes stop_codon:yes gene_type:complete
MLSKSVLTLDEANSMIDAAFAEADNNGWKVTVAVVDDGGHLLAMRRMDGCAPVAAYIAPQKARSAALGRRETSEFEAMINGGRTAFLSAPEITGLLEGGVPLKVDGQVVAAIGVSGVKPDQDAQVAKAGIAAL